MLLSSFRDQIGNWHCEACTSLQLEQGFRVTIPVCTAFAFRLLTQLWFGGLSDYLGLGEGVVGLPDFC